MEELKKCNRCKGEGQLTVKGFWPMPKRLKMCPDCEGEGVVIIDNKQTKKTLL